MKPKGPEGNSIIFDINGGRLSFVEEKYMKGQNNGQVQIVNLNLDPALEIYA